MTKKAIIFTTIQEKDSMRVYLDIMNEDISHLPTFKETHTAYLIQFGVIVGLFEGWKVRDVFEVPHTVMALVTHHKLTLIA